jgi:exodeoxyribonuclease VII large subunit
MFERADVDQWALDVDCWTGTIGTALSVSHVTRYLASIVRDDLLLQDVWVRGEVSNFTRAASGHLYFSLKDGGACLSCVMWRSSAFALPFRPEPGMQLLAHGELDIYAPRGQYQLIVDELQPDGEGAVYLALEQLKARLFAEGLFDPARKRPLPGCPQTVAVVTSLTGAAAQDICTTLQRDACPPSIVLIPALVQGDGAIESLCLGIRLANERSAADVIIVGCGGGSAEDLWAFNSEAVARAIAGSRLPVISAVGHETDFTLADLAADARAATPTAAAEVVVDRRAEWIGRMQRATAQVQGLFLNRMEAARLRWKSAAGRTPLTRPQWLIERRRQHLEDLIGRLLRSRDTCLARGGHRLALAVGKLESVSPLATLTRGYGAVTLVPGGRPVHRAADVQEGDYVRVQLSDGALEAQVNAVEKDQE